MNFTLFYIHVLEHGVHSIIIIITFKNSHKECAIGGRGDAYIHHKSLHDGGHCWRIILGGGVTGAGLLGGVSWGGGGRKEDDNSQCFFRDARHDGSWCGLTTFKGERHKL